MGLYHPRPQRAVEAAAAARALLTSEIQEASKSVPRRPTPSARRAADAVPSTDPIVVAVTIMPVSFGLVASPNSGVR